MRKFIVLLVFAALALGVSYVLTQDEPGSSQPETPNTETPSEEIPAVTVIAEDLEIPWDIAFLPDGGILVTERTGHVIAIAEDGSKHEIPIPDVKLGGEGGLLGLVLHPKYPENRLLYLYMGTPGNGAQTVNRVIRYKYENDTLTEDTVIIDGIPGALYHDGGRMEFGPDGMLYITTGDATVERLAQDRFSLGGKILRLKEDGSIPEDNPLGTAVYSYGHRNPQGLAWDTAGRLWETEHGPSSSLWPNCCQDEINLIEPGKNYGWPESVGDKVESGSVAPSRHSGRDVWAPASLVYLDGSLFFGGLRGEALYEAVLDGERVVEFKEHFKGEYGRIRTVRIGPDNMLYITTSNRDGRGSVNNGDDKIIRVNPKFLK
ncbi:PQQ-dependent sugar dehydrogenase [Candidatus Parcubacteria bacterium]|nr:MAG: PQQ-dependent sugar dehydrogenase [Candidatus Parcubacteria bacterium]